MPGYGNQHLNDLYNAMSKFYTDFTGKSVDLIVDRNIRTEVEGLAWIYNSSPNAFYVTVNLFEGLDRLPLSKDDRKYFKNAAESLAQRSEYSNLGNKLQNNNSQGGK